MNNAQLINQTSGEVEYYTPQPIIEAARLTLGRIDLDPASSVVANARVRAAHIFTATKDGLRQEWFGRVWMNHPFGRTTNLPWIKKLTESYRQHHIEAACCITFACTSEKWFRPLMEFPQCFLSPRTNYILPDGSIKKGVTKGSVVTYFGADLEAFRRNFEHLGVVKV